MMRLVAKQAAKPSKAQAVRIPAYTPVVTKKQANVLSIDIERAPMLVQAWGLFNQNIGIHQIINESKMISFAAIRRGDEDNPLYSSVYTDGEEKMLQNIWTALDNADFVVSYNGVYFDTKHIRTELMKAGLTPPSSWKDIDLLLHNRQQFNFDSNKLDHVAQVLGVGKKLDYGMNHLDLIKGCEQGDPNALAQLEEYNIQDTRLNLDLYDHYRSNSWID